MKCTNGHAAQRHAGQITVLSVENSKGKAPGVLPGVILCGRCGE